jgi:hypothetical protein
VEATRGRERQQQMSVLDQYKSENYARMTAAASFDFPADAARLPKLVMFDLDDTVWTPEMWAGMGRSLPGRVSLVTWTTLPVITWCVPYAIPMAVTPRSTTPEVSLVCLHSCTARPSIWRFDCTK